MYARYKNAIKQYLVTFVFCLSFQLLTKTNLTPTNSTS